MIVGNGLLASAFEAQQIKQLGATVFASGVSNSTETDPAAYAREESLLQAHLAAASGTFVYFSTCSIEDADRGQGPYAQHKRKMEEKVADRGDFLILRLPQVAGRTSNPHTLTNFLANCLRSGQVIPVWSSAIRCLVDVEHVAAITLALLQKERPAQKLDHVAPPEVLTMPQLIDAMEVVMQLTAKRHVIERSGGTRPDPTLMLALGPALGIDLSPGYTLRLLEKYYGSRDVS
jgi:nucleoside-diphosphate-sugar epimerase